MAKKTLPESKSLINRSLYPFFDAPRCHSYGIPEGPIIEEQTTCAVPLFKQLVGAQVDGVSLDNASLLQRQYDDEFGCVDPASDIHTDPHLLTDALIRRTMDSKIQSIKSE